ncbi:MAG: hypothetical protein GYB36_14370 [Alphaproteobacteria bacterium]|nr:hypothetical protein [Alphaproteobacteria bacterium]
MLVLFAAAVLSLQPASPDIDFAGVQAPLGGEPTRALVLGTQHFSQLPDGAFEPHHMDLVLDRLEEFAPDVIAIEAINGRGCETLRQYDALHPGVADRYCFDPALALQALGLTFPEAVVAMERILADFPDAPTAEQRRSFALTFFAAGEPWSAAVQWAYLDAAERVSYNGVTDELVEQFDRLLLSHNENNQIGVRLAVRRGLQTLSAMDDHSADLIQHRSPDTLGPVIQGVWQASRDGEVGAVYEATMSDLGSAEGLVVLHRTMNSAALQRVTIDADVGRAAATPDEDAVARHYVAWWQARGLRMAANVVEAAGNQPGARVLVVTGASHKAFFDAYLDQMLDWELVRVDDVMHD